jgi:hypothetical protein
MAVSSPYPRARAIRQFFAAEIHLEKAGISAEYRVVSEFFIPTGIPGLSPSYSHRLQ